MASGSTDERGRSSSLVRSTGDGDGGMPPVVDVAGKNPAEAVAALAKAARRATMVSWLTRVK